MLHRQNKSRFSLEYLFHRVYQSKQCEFSRDVETLATKSSMLCVLPSLTLPVSDSKSTKICFDPIQTLSITFFSHFTFPVASWSTQALHWWPMEGRRAICSDSQQKCTPPTWRWMGCGHTYLLPVAVCGEGPVSSPPQRCPVVVEVASGVHLVLHA